MHSESVAAKSYMDFLQPLCRSAGTKCWRIQFDGLLTWLRRSGCCRSSRPLWRPPRGGCGTSCGCGASIKSVCINLKLVFQSNWPFPRRKRERCDVRRPNALPARSAPVCLAKKCLAVHAASLLRSPTACASSLRTASVGSDTYPWIAFCFSF